MTRNEVWQAIERAHSDVRGLDVGRDKIEKAIDELINEEVRGRTFGPQIRERNDLAARFLAILIEKHDRDNFDRALAGRAIGYADDLIRTLRERRAP